jgi:Trk K+ transport system NAD-binding subunit
MADARWVVCTAPRRETNLAVLRAVKEHGYVGKVALTAHHADDAEILRAVGADLVLMPFVEAAKDAAAVLIAASTGLPSSAASPIENSKVELSSSANTSRGTT